MDTKGLRLEVKDEDRGIVSAVFATFNKIDSHRDVTIPGAFEDGAEVVISAYGHTSWEGMLPVGKGRIRQTLHEAIFEGRFFLDTTAGRDTFLTVKELGPLGQWSYGFDTLRESYGDHEGERVRFLESLKVHEVSPVLLGAGVNTRTLAVKRRAPEPLTADQLAVLRKAQEHAAAFEADQRSVLDEARATLARIDAEMLLREAATCMREEKEALRKKLKDGTVRWYVHLEADDVPFWKRAVAEVAGSRYSGDLGIPAPRVRWFRDETTAERHYLELFGEVASKGFGWPGSQLLGLSMMGDAREIWLSAEMHSAADIDAVAAHEVRHAAGGDETEARAYEAQARENYWNTESLA